MLVVPSNNISIIMHRKNVTDPPEWLRDSKEGYRILIGDV